MLLRAAPFIASAKLLHAGPLTTLAALQALVGLSHFIAPDHREPLAAAAAEAGQEPATALAETDPSGRMEGLYIKVEEGGKVTGRYKYVRHGFLQKVLDSGSHWQDRPLLENRLWAGVNVW